LYARKGKGLVSQKNLEERGFSSRKGVLRGSSKKKEGEATPPTKTQVDGKSEGLTGCAARASRGEKKTGSRDPARDLNKGGRREYEGWGPSSKGFCQEAWHFHARHQCIHEGNDSTGSNGRGIRGKGELRSSYTQLLDKKNVKK